MSGQQVIYLDMEGARRRYVLYRPTSIIANNAAAPLVIMLDGRGGTPWTAMKITQWNAKADREGFAVVYPEATRIDPNGPLHFLTNPQMWNAGAGGSDTERPHVDDMGFLRRLIDDVQNQAPVDVNRIYMTGFSNGAAMTYQFALTYPEILAAIAPVAGHVRTSSPMLRVSVPMIALFGRLDPLSPFDGGFVELPWGVRENRPPAIASIQAWAKACGHASGDALLEKYDGYSVYKYGSPGARDEICFIVVDDLGHVWPGGHRLLPETLVGNTSDSVSANNEIWSFFSRHQR